MFFRTFLTINCRLSPKSNFITYEKICNKSLHVASSKLTNNFIILTHPNHRPSTSILKLSQSFAFTRQISVSNTKNTDTSSTDSDIKEVDLTLSQIPNPPVSIEPEVVEKILGEPSFHSLGLGSWYPAGIVQQFLEILHINAGLPWWGTIIATTVCVRMIMFPLAIKMQKYSARMHNIQPQVQYLQEQLTEARKMGDQLQVCRLSYELRDVMNEKGANPLKNIFLPFIQAPVFLSFYWALRDMVQVPVESMKYGGLSWFENLTVPDRYYLLPILTSVTLAITIEMGTDNMKAQSMGTIRYILRSMPFIMFPFIINFEGAILCYWLTTNLFSLLQVSILRLPPVREYFQIPKLIKHDPNTLLITKKGFSQGFKESWHNVKMAREITSRQLYDDIVFEKAGKGPVPKTYKFNPVKSEVRDILLKKKD